MLAEPECQHYLGRHKGDLSLVDAQGGITMKTALILVAAFMFPSGLAAADPNDLRGGVFIAHFDPQVEWSDPLQGWCVEYLECCVITSCDQQNPMLPTEASHVWFVLAQWWEEPKTWCLSEFGFGDYDPTIYVFDTFGPCTPGAHLEISTPDWPGPMQGTAVATTDIPWSGNFVPVYYFTGYAYTGTGQIPFGPDPPTGVAGFVNCPIPPQEFEAACLPAMGIGVPGIECCGEEPQPMYPCCYGDDDEACDVLTVADCDELGGVSHPEWPNCGPPNPCIIRACCVGDDCYLVNEQECVEMDGWFLAYEESCEPETCPVTAACCVGSDCYVTSEEDCIAMGGIWHPFLPDCRRNPCAPTPTESTTWGSIKAIYR